MKRQKYFMFFLVAFVLSAVVIAYPTKKASAHGDDSQFIAGSSLLAGLAPGAVLPAPLPLTISRSWLDRRAWRWSP